VASRLGLSSSLKEGVYIQMGGPQFESVAELRMLKVMGVDAVGKNDACGPVACVL
jgi:purine-nucleoside phosphorylase